MAIVALAVVVGVISVSTGAGLKGLQDLAADTFWRLLRVKAGDVDVAPGSPADAAGRPANPDGAAGGVGEGAPGEDLVREETRFLWTLTYDGCGCGDCDETAASPGMVGLGEVDLESALPGAWSMASYSAERVELVRTVPGMCPLHSKRTLRLEDNGLLALYAGSAAAPGVRLIPVEPALSLEIEPSGLDPALVADLRSGITFESQEDVYRYLEGLDD